MEKKTADTSFSTYDGNLGMFAAIHPYSHGQFEKTLKAAPKPKPHPMIVLKFTSQGSL